MSMATDIADAVVVELNVGDFSEKFTAQRVTVPRVELDELSELRVSVVPRSVKMARVSNRLTKYIVQIDIGVQKKIGENELQDVAALGQLVDEISDFLKDRTLALLPNIRWITNKNEPIYSVDHLLQNRVFTSLLSAEYHLIR